MPDLELLEVKYASFVSGLKKPGGDILATLDPVKVDIIHMAIGIVGEAGEVADEVKKYVAYNTSLQLNKLIKELGDIEFYLEGIRQALGITRADVISANIKKLSERYGDNRYTDADAINRKDVK